LLEQGLDINHQTEDGNSVLMHALKHNNYSMINGLLEHELDIEHQNKNGDTPLMYAFLYCNYTKIKLLLNRGANINHRNKTGETSILMLAKSLVDRPEFFYERPVHIYYKCLNNYEKAKLLLERGANIN